MSKPAKPTRKAEASVAPKPVLVFVDTNIYLDFYRDSTEMTLKLLERLEPHRDNVISTYQVEMEFLKNRQVVLEATLKVIKAPEKIRIPGILADQETRRALDALKRTADDKAAVIRKKVISLLRKPHESDAVFKSLKTIVSSIAPHVLGTQTPNRDEIEDRANRRFLRGCPPRKSNDTSIGDALNWEWLLDCAGRMPGDFIVVSRDGDYGSTFNNEYFLNDFLAKEFSERAQKGNTITYTARLSDALKRMNVPVTEEEVKAESESIEETQVPLPIQIASKTDSESVFFTEMLKRFWTVQE